MAIDVIVRPDGHCLTIVCDVNTETSDHVVIIDRNIYFRCNSGDYLIGELAKQMLADAISCHIALVVKMDGDFVHSFRQVEFSKL